MRVPLLALGSSTLLTCILAVGALSQEPEQPEQKKEEKQPAAADQQPVSSCPNLTLKAPTQPVRDGVPIKFTLALAGGDAKISPMFDWSISAGVIRSGQGTPTIDVDTTGAGADKTIYATVLIGGFAPECISSVHATATVAGPAQKVDEFGDLPAEEQAARLDNFLSSVSSSDQAYIFAYAGRTNPRGHASATLRQIRAHALKSGITSDRLITIDGGFREEAVYELWIVPIGSEAPRPSPTVSAKEIVFPKPAPPVKKKP